MKNNTIITAGDRNYLWGIFLLIASLRRNGMDEPVIVGTRGFDAEAEAILSQMGDVRFYPLDSFRRSLTCCKAQVMLQAETDYITWVDSDGFFVGNCSARLIPETPGEIHARMRSPEEQPQAFKGYLCGIRPLEPGFRKFLVDPQPGCLKHFKVKTPTPHGAILLAMPELGRYQLTVPEGTTAVFQGKEYPAGKHELK